MVGSGEACDPGQVPDFRACSQLCKVQSQFSSIACSLASPLAFATVGPARTMAKVQGIAFGSEARFHGACFGSSPQVGLVRITVPSRSTLRVDTDSDSTDLGIALFTDDCLAPKELACVSEPGGLSGHRPLEVTLDAGTYVVAFNNDPTAVNHWLIATLTLQQ